MGLSSHPRDPDLFLAPLSRVGDRYIQGMAELDRVQLRACLRLAFLESDEMPARSDIEAAFQEATASGEAFQRSSATVRRPSGAVSTLRFRTIQESSGVPYAERAEATLRPDRGSALDAMTRFCDAPGMPLTVRLWFSHDLVPGGEARAIEVVDACDKAGLLPGRVVVETIAPPSPVAIPLWETRIVRLRQRGARIALRYDEHESPPEWLRDVPFDYLYVTETPDHDARLDPLLGWFDGLRRPKLRLVLAGISSEAQLRLASSVTHALRAGEAVGRARRL